MILDIHDVEHHHALVMKARSLLALLVLGLVVCLRPMAFASPPDESWPYGFWDDGDYDDVILLLTGGTPATTTLHFAYDARPAPLVAGAVAGTVETPAPAPLLSTRHVRAPPVR